MFWPTIQPSRNASTSRGSATPAFAPRVRHSASSRSMLIARALWTSLVIDPAPSSPTQTTLFEKVWSTGFTRCRMASSPPTNRVTFPSRAPSRPPSRGASSRCAPRAFSASPTARTTAGAFVVWSITTDPAVTPSRIPPAPTVTACISGGPGTQTQMTSHCAATSLGDGAHTAPRSSSVAAASCLRSWTTSEKAPLRTKSASGSPMFPRPMNPTRIASSRFENGPRGTTPDPSRGTRLLRQQSLRTPDHQYHEHHADEDLLRRGQPYARQERDHVLRDSAAFEKAEEHGGAEEGTAVVAAAPENEREPDEEAFLRQEHVRLDVGEIVCEENAGESRDAGAEGEG